MTIKYLTKKEATNICTDENHISTAYIDELFEIYRVKPLNNLEEAKSREREHTYTGWYTEIYNFKGENLQIALYEREGKLSLWEPIVERRIRQESLNTPNIVDYSFFYIDGRISHLGSSAVGMISANKLNSYLMGEYIKYKP